LKSRDKAGNQTGLNSASAEGSSSSVPLKSLVLEAQRGDVNAFKELYGRYVHKIVNFLYRMTGSREEAEDLAQDTFVLVYRKIGDLKDPERFQSWLFRIAQNNVYQLYRGRKVQLDSIDQEETQELTDMQKLTTPIKSPEDAFLSNELEDLISRTIAQLPDKYRTVFVLSAIQKMSYQEISSIVDRSLASVKSDIHRARVIIRDKIKRYLGEANGVSDM
jgi:RNA polymerase sigma-70 factor (ECF subfamily)